MESAMELRHLRYFVAVAEAGSLTVAPDLAAADGPHKIAAKGAVSIGPKCRTATCNNLIGAMPPQFLRMFD
jgi:hypothetical protein